MSEYQVKLEAVEEYLNALHYKKLNEELCASLLGLLGQLTRYYEKSGMPLPDEVSRIMTKTHEALDARLDAPRPPSVKRLE